MGGLIERLRPKPAPRGADAPVAAPEVTEARDAGQASPGQEPEQAAGGPGEQAPQASGARGLGGRLDITQVISGAAPPRGPARAGRPGGVGTAGARRRGGGRTRRASAPRPTRAAGRDGRTAGAAPRASPPGPVAICSGPVSAYQSDSVRPPPDTTRRWLVTTRSAVPSRCQLGHRGALRLGLLRLRCARCWPRPSRRGRPARRSGRGSGCTAWSSPK